MAFPFPYPNSETISGSTGQGCISCVTGRPFKHGRNGYIFHKCRCEICRTSATNYLKGYITKKKENKAWLSVDFKHGVWGYDLGCRCDICIMAESENKKEYRQNNLEAVRKRERDHVRLHAEIHRKRVIEYNKEHKEGQKIRQKRYGDKHREQIRKRASEYRKNNKTKIRNQQREYQRLKYITDVCYRIRVNLRNRVSGAINRGCKSANTLTLLGYSIPELKDKLTVKFVSGMSWDNYGEWSIDHIIPCAAFDLTTPLHQRACFNWKNLQPMWRLDNQKKNDTIPLGLDVKQYISSFAEDALKEGVA